MKMRIVGILLLTAGLTYGQHNGEWYKESVHGLELSKAQEFLKGKKIKKNPVVALLTNGIDHEHEMLVNSLWVNAKEKQDGIDNDKNGYIDDLHGWNFLGSRDGEDMLESTTREADREWLRLRDKYADLMYNKGEYFKFVDGEKVIVPAPENKEEYDYFNRLTRLREGDLAPKYASYNLAQITRDFVMKWDKELATMMPGVPREEMKSGDCFKLLANRYNSSAEPDSLEGAALVISQYYTGMLRMRDTTIVVPWKRVYDNFTTAQVPHAKKSFDTSYAKRSSDGRKEIVGDNYLDFDDRYYGNNMLLTPQSTIGTALAGILINVCPNVKIMPLIVFTNEGDPYLKDIVNAIRYAVDKGADVIIATAQSRLASEEQRSKVADAIKYAEKKGVLVVVPTPEHSSDIDKQDYFPSVEMDKRFKLNNLLVVANSDSLGQPFINSNYGAGKLDIYAPGRSIYTSTPGDLYRTASNTYFGAAMSAGVGALIKAYNPKLTGTQIRDIIIKNPTSRRGIEVEKGILVNDKPAQDLFLFEQLCVSAGILNANNAVRAAFNKK